MKAVCVLGMHRSGTSVVSRMTELLGAYLGPEEHQMAPRQDNPKGFWEHHLLVAINDEILLRHGGSWDNPPELPDGWERSPALADLRERAEAVIRDDFGGEPLWSWKDPRTCLTLPFWQQLIPSMSYVICLRNPADVARSLESRDGFSIEKGAELWLVYTASALRSTSGQSRLLIFYDEVMQDPVGELKRLGTFLGTSDLADQPGAQREIREFLEDGLYHHRTSVSQGVNESALAFPASSLYLALRTRHARLLNHGTDEDLDAALDHLSARAHERYLAQKQSEQAADVLQAQLSDALAQRQHALADRDQLAVAASQLRAELQREALQIQAVSSAIKERDDQIEHLKSQLIESRDQVRRMQGSLSWRLTAPLRTVRGSVAGARLRLAGLKSRMAGLAAYRRVARSGLFDKVYYLQTSVDVARSRIPPLVHYLAIGWREGRDPNPLFNTNWYLSRNPDVAASGVHPLAHYARFGAAEGRDPHPLFDTRWYLRRNPDVAASGMNPLTHFISIGAAEGRDPHPLFDADWYLRENPDVAASGMNPLAHYIHLGASEGRDPHPLFDADWYLANYPDVGVARCNPLVHYLCLGANENKDPNPFFDSRWYTERNTDAGEADLNPLVHFVEKGSREQRNPSSRFSCRSYLEANPDVRLLGTCPLEHYLLFGIKQGRPLQTEERPIATGVLTPDPRRAIMIDSIYPRPDRDAGSLVALNLLKAVLPLGYTVSFAATSEFSKESPYKDALREMGVEVVDGDTSFSVEEFIRVEGSRAGVFFLSRVHAGGHYFDLVRTHAPRSKIIFNTVDLHSIREQREATLRNDRRALHLGMRTWERELYIARLADATIVVSPVEAALLRKHAPGAKIVEVPLAHEFHGRTRAFEARSGIGFVGGFQHLPNPDAVRFFLSEIWPAIREKKPELTFHVIGPDIPPDIASRSDPGLVVVGHVPDLAAALSKLRMTVAPLRYGAGAKGKIVSSLSAGVPSVITPVAAEGLALVDGETILIGRSPREFVEQVLRLYDDELLWYRLSDKGLDLFKKQHSFEIGAGHIADLLSGIGLPANRRETVDLAAR